MTTNVAIPLSTRLRGGNEGTGGGDPIAADFSRLAAYVSEYLVDHPQVSPSTSRENVRSLGHDISEALAIESTGGRVEVVDTVAPGESPFLVTSAAPLQITISRVRWNALTERQRLDHVTRLMISLSVEERTESIPLPVSGVERYLDRMEACVISVEHMNEAAHRYENATRNCVAAPIGQRTRQRALIDVSAAYVARINELCQRYCRTPQQVFTGAATCAAYVSNQEADLRRLARITPDCVSP